VAAARQLDYRQVGAALPDKVGEIAPGGRYIDDGVSRITEMNDLCLWPDNVAECLWLVQVAVRQGAQLASP